MRFPGESRLYSIASRRRGSIADRFGPISAASAASTSVAQRSAARSFLTTRVLGSVRRRIAQLAELGVTDCVLRQHLELLLDLVELLREPAHETDSLLE